MRSDDFFRRLDEEVPADPAIAAEVDPPFVLAGNVYALRRERGLTQAQLAEAVGVHQPRIAEIERGDANPRLDTLAKLARALGVPVAALLHAEAPGSDRVDETEAVYPIRKGDPVRKVAESR